MEVGEELFANVEVLHKRNGEVIDRERTHNILVDDGLGLTPSYKLDDAYQNKSKLCAIAIGDGVTGESATDSALVNELFRENASGYVTTTNVTDDTANLDREFSGYSGNESITESGVFNANESGIGSMYARVTFAVKNVDWSTDSLTLKWDMISNRST